MKSRSWSSSLAFLRASALALLAGLALPACGGPIAVIGAIAGAAGGGGGKGGDTTRVITGQAVKGPVAGGRVRAFAMDASASAAGAALAEATTDAQGNFSLTIAGHTGPLLIEVDSGSYVDEATGQTVDLAAAQTKLTLALRDANPGAPVAVTPLTRLAAQLAAKYGAGATTAGLPEAITRANAEIAGQFGLSDIVKQRPRDLGRDDAIAAADEQAKYALVLAGLSQQAADMGASSASFVHALANDIADGIFDGQNDARKVWVGVKVGSVVMPADAATSKLATAMDKFASTTFPARHPARPALPADLTGAKVLPPVPRIDKIEPASGTANTEIAITVTGTNFVTAGGDGLIQIFVGGKPATEVNPKTPGSLTAKTPKLAPGTCDVVVINPRGGRGVLKAAFEVFAPAQPPVIDDISPSSGSAAGGFTVTIKGSGFKTAGGTAIVKFGDKVATDVVVVDDKTITVTAPAGSVGSTDVTVTNANGTGVSKAAGFQYLEADPPAAIADLTASPGSQPGEGDVTLAWTAPGDDGTTGTATAYDVRYATSTIDSEATWNTATVFMHSTSTLPNGLAGKIAYVNIVTPGADGEIFLHDTMTGANSQITNDSVGEGWPAFNQAGDRLIFTQGAGTGWGGSIYSIKLDGTSLTLLSSANTYETAHVARDGRITAGNGAVNKIWTMNADGSSVTAIYSGGDNQLGSAWSADGSKIAWCTDKYSGSRGIRIANANGTGVYKLGAPLGLADWGQLSWSPDGSVLAYANQVGSEWRIFYVSTANTTSTPVQVTSGSGNHRSPEFLSNDWLLYSSDEGGDYDLYVIKKDGTRKQRLTDLPGDEVTPRFQANTFSSHSTKPSVAGTKETLTVTGLTPGQTYFFAIKTADEVPNWSGLSNSPSARAYAPPPVIDDISPASGPATGGFTVTIRGSGFSANSAGAPTVKFGDVAAAGVTVVDDNTMTVTAPASATGTMDVTVTNANGSAVSKGGDGTWVAKVPMPTARSGLAAAAVNGIVYAIGGYQGSFPATVEAYDPATNTWTTKAPMPTARHDLAVATINGIVYAIGGATSGMGSIPTATVEAYDPTTDTWTAKAPMPTARNGLVAAEVNGIIYAIGGLRNNTTTLATVEAYNPASNTWTTKTPMPTARFDLAVATINGIVYAIGGYRSGSTLATLEAYDPASDTWTTRSSMPTARRNLSATAFGKIFYAIGGSISSTPGSSRLATVEAYDTVTNTWTSKAPMPTARISLSATSAGGIVYAIGGSNGTSNLTALESFVSGSFQYLEADAPTAIADLAASPGSQPGEVKLTWTAPGDDGTTGTAAVYEVRHAASAIATEAAWNAATVFTHTLKPSAAGTTQTLTVTGLSPGQTYFFAIKTADEVPNWSGLSNSPSARARGPAPTVTGVSIQQIDNTGGIEITITGTGFKDKDVGVLAVSVGGIAAAKVVVVNDTTAIVTTAAGGEGAADILVSTIDGSATLSSSASGFALRDAMPPTAITDLAAVQGTTPGEVVLTWAAVGDNETQGTAAAYIVRYAATPIGDETTFGLASPYSQSLAPKPPGQKETLVVAGLTPGRTYHFAVKARDEVPLVSALSNSAQGRADGPDPVVASVYPLQGPDTGGTTLTIRGSGFLNDFAGTPVVTIGSSEAGSVVVQDDATITCVSPAGPEGTADIAVTNANGTGAYTAGVWRAFPPLLNARKELAGAAHDGKVYALGGQNSSSLLDSVEVFDPVAHAWSPGVKLLRTHVYFSATAAGGKLYALGTWSGNRTIETFDPVGGSWSFGTSMPSGHDGGASVTLGGEIYAIGGSSSNTVNILDVTAGTWRVGGSLTVSRASIPGAAVLDGGIYVVGGNNNSNLASTEVYAPATGTWSAGPALATARRRLACVALDGKLYAIGGQDSGNQYLKSVEVLDPATGTWSSGPSLSTARANHAAVTLDRRIYVFGGYNGGDLGSLEVYSLPFLYQDTTSPAAITDLNATPGSEPGRIQLTWTAPGDNGVQGLATKYVLKYSTSPIVTGADFDNATLYVASATWTPAVPGTTETKTLSFAEADWGTVFHFAVKTSDEADNVPGLSSGPSTSARVKAPDPVISEISPSSSGAGTQVTITGQGFQAYLATAPAVKIGTTAAANVQVVDDRTVTAEVPAIATTGNPPFNLPVTLSNSSGTVVFAGSGAGTGTFTELSSRTPARADHAVAAWGGKLYVLGGRAGSASALADAYDPATDAWTTLANLPTPRDKLAAAAVDGKVYAIGGEDAGLSPSAVLEAYDVAQASWSAKTSMGTARHGLATVAVDGKLYAVGGLGASGVLATVEVYDPQTDAWANKAPMGTARTRPFAAAWRGKIYVFGGYGASGYTDKAEAYDVAANTWSPIAPLPAARGVGASAVANNRIFLFGGNGGVRSAEVLIYDPLTDQYVTDTALDAAVDGLAAAPIGYEVYLFGGATDAGLLDSLRRFTPPGGFRYQ